jgi:hypothetical protein
MKLSSSEEEANDEILPIMNKSKHPKKKGEYKGQNRRTHNQEDKKNHLRG